MSVEFRPQQVHRMMAYSGSSELVSLTLAAAQPDVDYSEGLMYNQVMDLQGNDPAWNLDRRTPYAYMETMSKAGFVMLDPETRTCSLSDMGDEIGKSLTGHLLKLSSGIEPAQSALVGPSTGNPNWLPIRSRLAILPKLIAAEGKPLKFRALAGSNTGPYAVLHSLAESKVIHMETEGRRAVAHYAPGSNYQAIHSNTSRSEVSIAVVKVLKKAFDKEAGHALTNADVVNLIQESDISFEQHMTTEELTFRVAKTTAYLKSINLIANKVLTDDSIGGCRVWLDEAQTRIASRLVAIYENLRRPTASFLDDGRAMLEEITNPTNREVVDNLAYKALGTSTHLQRNLARRATLAERILRILDGTNEATLIDIHNTLKAESIDGPHSIPSIDRSLKRLAEEEQVTATTKRHAATAPRFYALQGRAKDIENKGKLAAYWGSAEQYNRLLGYIAKRVPDWHTAEDVAMEVLAAIIAPKTKAPVMDAQSACSGWVYKVASNKIADYFRKRERNQRSDELVLNMQEDPTHANATPLDTTAFENVAREGLQQLVAGVLDEVELTPHLRGVLELELIDPNMTIEEGGQRLGVSAVAFRVGRHRVREKIRPMLASRLSAAAANGQALPMSIAGLFKTDDSKGDPSI